MRTIVAILIASLLLATPAASAAGHLVNVGIGSSSLTFGSNVFGGSGDTLDVGILNEQCTDEADFVDVGILNSEGAQSASCGGEWRECHHAKGEDPLPFILDFGIFQSEADETPARCSDESDTLDVGVLNQEGSHQQFFCDERGCYEGVATGDEKDATDVGVLNHETGDDDDGNDAGVVNCETNDRRDSTDAGLLNREEDDGQDTFDASLFNTETLEGGDANGINVGSGMLGIQCIRVDIVAPVLPRI